MRNPQLDGLRGIAIALVIPFHATTWLPWLPLAGYGWAGVDAFFVLSGFLITRILLQTRAQPGYWWSFAERRVRRIFPLYFAVLALVGVIRLFGGDHDSAAPWWMYATFTSNVWQATHGMGTRLLRVTWSLACEEQFYLLWPWVVLLSSRRVLVALSLAGLVLAPLLRHAALGTYGAEYLLPMRMDGLAAGALLALVEIPPWGWVVWAAGSLLDQHSVAVVVAAGALVAAERGRLPWLAWRPLTALGTISYGLYLLHLPLMGWLGPVVGAVQAVVMAALSWVLLERPIIEAGHQRTSTRV